MAAEMGRDEDGSGMKRVWEPASLANGQATLSI